MDGKRRRARLWPALLVLTMSVGGVVAVAPVASASAVPSPGSFDASFGSSGIAREAHSEYATGVAVVPSGATHAGDIVVSTAGTEFGNSGNPAFRVERFTGAGTVDTSFAGGAAAPFAGVAQAVAVTSTGAVVAVGYESTPSNCDGRTPVVVEFSPTGSPVFVTTVTCPTGGGQLNAVALTPTGQIVVVGDSLNSTATASMLIADLTAAGSLNSTFNLTGATTLNIATGQTHGLSVAVAGNGDFVATGYSYPTTSASFLTLAAFKSNGALDSSFTCSSSTCASPEAGVVYPADQSGSIGYGVTRVGANLVAAGTAGNGHVFLFGVTDAGSPIAGFGTGGEVTGAQVGQWNGVTYQSTGGYLVAAGQVGQGATEQFLVSEFKASTGSLNTSFASGGTLTKSYPTGPAAANAVAFDPEGRVLAAGEVPVVNAVPGTAVARLIGPAVSVANHGVVQVTTYGPVTMTMSASLDEALNSSVNIELCTSTADAQLTGGGRCASFPVAAGKTRFAFSLTVDVTVPPGHSETVSVGLASGYFPGTGSSGSVEIEHILAPASFVGYRLVASDGGIFAFGHAPFYGSTGGVKLVKPIVGMATTPDGKGYWLVASDGGIFAYGDARFYGSTGGVKLTKPIVAMAATPDGKGYWLVASDGGIFAYGDARFHGSTGGVKLTEPIVDMAATPDGGGYWLVASDGGIFAFGDAPFLGSTGGVHLTKPIVAIAAFPGGPGYWLVASDGGIFAYGAARFHGSTGGVNLTKPIVGMAATSDGGGYWLVASDGGIFAYGDAHFYGSTGGVKLVKPIVGMTGP